MAYEQKDGQGNLFKNDKGGNDKRPDYRGEITVGGTKYKLSAWLKDGQKGKYMSISAQPMTDDKPADKPKPAPAVVDDDENLPF